MAGKRKAIMPKSFAPNHNITTNLLESETNSD